MSSKAFVLGLILLVLGLDLNAQVLDAPQYLSPTYTSIETYTIALTDSEFKSLYYSAEGENASIVVYLCNAVKNKDIQAYNPYTEEEMSWSEIDAEINEYGMESFSLLKLEFIAFYNEDNIAFHKRLVSVSPAAIFDDGWDSYYYRTIFQLNSDGGKLEKLLVSQKSAHPDYKFLSYWDILHGVSTKYLISQSYCSIKYASEKTAMYIGGMPSRKDAFDFPRELSGAMLSIRKLPYSSTKEMNIDEVKNNKFLAEFGVFNEASAIFKELSNLSIYHPQIKNCGYSNLCEMIQNLSDQSNVKLFEYNSEGHFTSEIEKDASENMFIDSDTIRIMGMDDEYTDTVITRDLEIYEYYVLEVSVGERIIPIAIAPTKTKYNEYNEFTGEFEPLCWIPFNSAFQSLLFNQEVYFAGEKAMSFGEYFRKNKYLGEIIYERKLDNTEWQKMLKVLE